MNSKKYIRYINKSIHIGGTRTNIEQYAEKLRYIFPLVKNFVKDESLSNIDVIEKINKEIADTDITFEEVITTYNNYFIRYIPSTKWHASTTITRRNYQMPELSIITNPILFEKHNKLSLYDEMINKLDNPDTYVRNDGMTPLMILAGMARYSHETVVIGVTDNKKNMLSHIISKLLDKGSSILNINQIEYSKTGRELNALSYAIINVNRIAIDMFINKLGNSIISSPTKNFLQVYNNEPIDMNTVNINIIRDLYRLANEVGNYEVVIQIFNSNEDIRNLYNENKLIWENDDEVIKNRINFYYPPLWLYNIVDMKKYMLSLLDEIKPYIIEEKDLRYSGIKEKYDYAEIIYNGETIKLYDKTPFKNHLGRILGANHLRQCLRKESHYKVPRKFLILPSKDNITFEITIPNSQVSSLGEGSLISSADINPINVEILGAKIYAEYIENGHFILLDPECGWIDNKKENAMMVEKNGINFIYYIDTGDDKNFLIPVGDNYLGYEGKVLNWNPNTEIIRITI